jgi:hypothetical protein
MCRLSTQQKPFFGTFTKAVRGADAKSVTSPHIVDNSRTTESYLKGKYSLNKRQMLNAIAMALNYEMSKAGTRRRALCRICSLHSRASLSSVRTCAEVGHCPRASYRPWSETCLEGEKLALASNPPNINEISTPQDSRGGTSRTSIYAPPDKARQEIRLLEVLPLLLTTKSFRVGCIVQVCRKSRLQGALVCLG